MTAISFVSLSPQHPHSALSSHAKDFGASYTTMTGSIRQPPVDSPEEDVRVASPLFAPFIDGNMQLVQASISIANARDLKLTSSS
jgi:hypothetical protein